MLIKQTLNMQSSKKEDQRLAIRNRLKGTLSAWKHDLQPEKGPKFKEICDRTPVPGITDSVFEDSFDLRQMIGQGASGTVHLCFRRKNNKLFAVKISRGGQEMLRIIKNTFKILKMVKHPDIIRVKYLYLNEVRQKTHLVMEYFPHPSLEGIAKTLAPQESKKIVTKVLMCLKYLHAKGICHRDIKLDNVLYDRENEKIKLIDFGICKKNSQKDQGFEKMWTITGTLQYMAPEMLIGCDYDEKVDCWAVGVMVYRLFYLRFPFESEYKSEIIEQITKQEPEYPENEPLLNNFLRRLLSKNPQTRINASQALRHPWIENDTAMSGKARFSSGQSLGHLEKTFQNYSNIHYQSPIMNCSKEEVTDILNEITIFENKLKTRSISQSPAQQ